MPPLSAGTWQALGQTVSQFIFGRHVRRGLDPALWFEDLVVLAELVLGAVQVSGVSQDPDDDKYPVAAVAGRASFVVTGDPHLLTVGQYEGIRIVNPRALLDLLGS